MKIDGSSSSRPTRGAARSATAGSAEAKAVGSAPAPARAPDSASFMGIPEAELTPKVQAALTQLMAEVRTLQQELDRAYRRIDQLERLSDEDPLLPILNRRAFVRELRRAVSFADRYDVSGSIIYLDVNNLKRFNDAYGHRAGDVALKEVAAVLLRNLRSSDVIGRLGGDEFGIILTQADEPTALAKAEALARLIAENRFSIGEAELSVGVTYGVHSLSGKDGVDEVIDAADRAMYSNKYGTS